MEIRIAPLAWKCFKASWIPGVGRKKKKKIHQRTCQTLWVFGSQKERSLYCLFQNANSNLSQAAAVVPLSAEQALLSVMEKVSTFGFLPKLCLTFLGLAISCSWWEFNRLRQAEAQQGLPGTCFLFTALCWGMFCIVSQAVKGIDNFGTKNMLSVAQNTPWFCDNLAGVQCGVDDDISTWKWKWGDKLKVCFNRHVKSWHGNCRW